MGIHLRDTRLFTDFGGAFFVAWGANGLSKSLADPGVPVLVIFLRRSYAPRLIYVYF